MISITVTDEDSQKSVTCSLTNGQVREFLYFEKTADLGRWLQPVLKEVSASMPIPQTFEGFVNWVSRSPFPTSWREGQNWFNRLFEVRPDLANKVRGEPGLDPFHHDELIRSFLAWLAKEWK